MLRQKGYPCWREIPQKKERHMVHAIVHVALGLNNAVVGLLPGLVGGILG
jgi:hypothetical protein